MVAAERQSTQPEMRFINVNSIDRANIESIQACYNKLISLVARYPSYDRKVYLNKVGLDLIKDCEKIIDGEM